MDPKPDPLKPDPKAHEEARQALGLLPFAHPIPEDVATAAKKTPRDWAVQKGLLKLNRDKSIHYTTHTPWQYQAAFVVHRWPDPEVDPTFVLDEAEFDEAIEAAVAGRTLAHHREHKTAEEAREQERKRAEDEKLRALAAQLDANNAELAAAAAAATPSTDAEAGDAAAPAVSDAPALEPSTDPEPARKRKP